MSQVNQVPSPGQSPAGRPGQMTAVMKAMTTHTGPKVLRIGVVNAGRILEERIIKQRTAVTIGSNEKAMFVLQAPNLPAQFKLFELVGADYHLNFLDGMTGRIALQTGISDLAALKGQAKKVGQGYQIKLTEDARGKVTVGETTLLFQFVAPPPVQPRPQLPLAVKGGVASQIDWNLTIIAAFSFLIHFGLVGAMYSDWMDPVVNEDVTAALLDMLKEPPLPPVQQQPEVTDTKKEAEAKEEKAPPKPAEKVQQKATQATPADTRAADQQRVQALIKDRDAMLASVLTAVGGGKSTQELFKGGEAHTMFTDAKEASSDRGMGGEGALGHGGGRGPVGQIGGADTLNVAGTDTKVSASTAGTARKVVPVTVEGGAVVQTVQVQNAEAVVRKDIHPRARQCFQKGLEDDPNQGGKLVVVITVGPSGRVESATAASNSGLSQKTVNCILSAAKIAKFEKPAEGARSQMTVPLVFTKAGN